LTSKGCSFLDSCCLDDDWWVTQNDDWSSLVAGLLEG
jgi:hypothetical protein